MPQFLRFLLGIIAGLWLTAVVPNQVAAEATKAQAERCLNQCIAAALAGQRQPTDCLNVPFITQQLIGPSARGMSQSQIDDTARRVVVPVMQAEFAKNRASFAGTTVMLDDLEPGEQLPNYFASGTITYKGQPEVFEANGFFVGESQCLLHTLSIRDAGLTTLLREHPDIRPIIPR